MSADWQAGDLALCVNDMNIDGTPLEVRSGAIYTVLEVFQGVDEVTAAEALALALVGVAHVADGIDADCFRKIRPHTPDAEDAETIRLLNGLPVREPVA